MVVGIANVIAVIGGVGLIVFLVWIASRGHDDRAAEQAAREYLSEHGHWPDDV